MGVKAFEQFFYAIGGNLYIRHFGVWAGFKGGVRAVLYCTSVDFSFSVWISSSIICQFFFFELYICLRAPLLILNLDLELPGFILYDMVIDLSKS